MIEIFHALVYELATIFVSILFAFCATVVAMGVAGFCALMGNPFTRE